MLRPPMEGGSGEGGHSTRTNPDLRDGQSAHRGRTLMTRAPPPRLRVLVTLMTEEQASDTSVLRRQADHSVDHGRVWVVFQAQWSPSDGAAWEAAESDPHLEGSDHWAEKCLSGT